MISKFTALSSVFITTAVLFSGAPVARAGSLNTAGTVCRNYNAGEALDIDFLQDGARNINASPRPVICPIPRPSQVAGGNTGDEVPPVSFFIDGWNLANTSTSCTVYSYSYDNILLATRSFTVMAPSTSSTSWDRAVTFPVAQLPAFGYNSMLCTLPGGGAGVIVGAAAMQP